ncbi:MAG TPA: aminotransferase [Rhizomicrobium sp.]|jgi:4-aminobutyrate--pyruvate transaminase
MIRNDTALATADVKHVIHGFTNLSTHEAGGPKIIVRGEGVRVIDDTGRDYIEAAGGMWCAALGFSESALAEAASEQLARLPYYHTLTSKSVDRSIELAEKLCAIVPIPDAKVYFAVTGSEGNDYVVKFLWAYNNIIGRPQKKKVITRWGAYHGATIGATSLTGLARNHALFDAPLDRFLHTGNMHHYMEAHDGESEEEFAARRADELEAQILREGPDTVMAFMAEPVMGGGGVILPPADYYARVQKVLKKYDIMFLADEVITGFGRTGNMFGCETFEIQPDTMVLGKGITAAYQPLAAVVLSDQIYQGLKAVSDQVGSFAHGATYSGHPVAVAVGLKTIELMEQRNILANVRASGAYLRERLDALRDWPFVGEVRGVGLVAAIQFVRDKKTKRLLDPVGSFAARLQALGEDHGIITRLSANDTIAFAPPLCITRAEVGEMMDRFEKALKDAIAVTPK